MMTIIDMGDPTARMEIYKPIVQKRCGDWDDIVTLPDGGREFMRGGEIIARVEAHYNPFPLDTRQAICL